MHPTLDSLRQRAEPWWQPYRAGLDRVLVAASRAETFAAALNAAITVDTPIDVRFVPHSALPSGEPYEAFIARTARVPTRENLHDLLNGLMWLHYPLTKRRMNALQAAQIEQLGTTGARGPVRDALTVFDENAALLHAPPCLIDALRRRDWRALFVEHRALWAHARSALFGHALLEKLIVPRKAITAHVWLVDDWSDAAIAASLTPERLATKPFFPLPVLGVPGWWSANEDPAFYDDEQVFRSRPTARIG